MIIFGGAIAFGNENLFKKKKKLQKHICPPWTPWLFSRRACWVFFFFHSEYGTVVLSANGVNKIPDMIEVEFWYWFFMFALCVGAQDLVFVWARVKPTKSIRFRLCKCMFMLCGVVSLAKHQSHTLMMHICELAENIYIYSGRRMHRQTHLVMSIKQTKWIGMGNIPWWCKCKWLLWDANFQGLCSATYQSEHTELNENRN